MTVLEKSLQYCCLLYTPHSISILQYLQWLIFKIKEKLVLCMYGMFKIYGFLASDYTKS